MKYFYFAQAYGEAGYGECTYNDQTSTTQASCPGSETGSGGGGLSDTGVWVVALVTLACVIVLASILVRFWKRKPRQAASPDAEKPKSTDQ